METSKPKLVPFPERNIQDVAGVLRRLADAVEAGKLGDPTDLHLAWVTVDRDRKINTGLIGAESNRFTYAGMMLAGANHITKEP